MGGGQSARGRGVRSVQPGGGSQPVGGSAKIGQQNEYSLHGGRYASCIHAGGLSCLTIFLPHQAHIVFVIICNIPCFEISCKSNKSKIYENN